MHLVITDSGLGGLSICAALEKTLRETQPTRDVRMTYVNAWPEEGRGYNDLPDPAARARVFDRALSAMAGMKPDLLLVACNTLSILYELTEFRRTTGITVRGIIDPGVDLFHEALTAEPDSAVVLLGTRTTIESGVHRERLLGRSVPPDRVAAVSCHGLATAIEHGPTSAAVDELIDTYAERAAAIVPAGEPVYAGLCCTHYSMVADRISAALARKTGRLVGPLDPNERLVRDVATRLTGSARGDGVGSVQVEVISKVGLDEGQRDGVSRAIEAVSPATAAALRHYRRLPELF
ncbi:MAG TPA: aspartate/glutamate racemase family protein [Vicinamibacterales bacterium]|nr:aspartate/glutamate racemase family protein [Vicinamibacterales bacterium]